MVRDTGRQSHEKCDPSDQQHEKDYFNIQYVHVENPKRKVGNLFARAANLPQCNVDISAEYNNQ